MKTAAFTLLLTALASCACAQALAPELAPIATKYKADVAMLESQRSAAITQSQNAYTVTLGTAERSATTAGNVAAVAAIATERASISSGLMSPGFPPGLPKELQASRKTYLDGLSRIRAVDAPRRQAIDAAYLRALATLDLKGTRNPELPKQLESERKDLMANTPTGAGGSKPNAKNAVINGTFELADEKGLARGWTLNIPDADFKVVRDGSNSVLHASAKIPAYVEVTQDILLPAKARTVTLSGRVRGKLTARKPDEPDFGQKISAVYLDAQGSKTKNWIISVTEISAEWKTFSQTQRIVEDMKSLQVHLSLKQAAGDFDFDDVVVEFR